MAKNTTKLIALTILTLMILATAPSFVLAEPEWQAQPMHHVAASGIDPALIINGNFYVSPSDIKAAYGLPADNNVGTGTIAIVDAYDNPRVATDLATFSQQFGLPAANLEIHKMSRYIPPDVNWGVEINLDVQWAHAIAPASKILLVEAKSAYFSDLLSAVNYARSRSDVVAISMSWGGPEFSGQTTYNSYFTSQYGAAFFAASGDIGAAISWPSSSANVVSVGGTYLAQDSQGIYSQEAWSSSGGGVSAYEPKPTYQNSLTYSNRATPDVSYNAVGFLVYDSYGTTPGYYAVDGTSAGSPQWAAIYAIGKSATNANFYSNYIYGSSFTDISSGSSGYPAITGYDLATGIGSPIGVNFAAPPEPDFSISASPSAVTITTATNPTGTAAINVGSIGGFTSDVALSASDPSNKLTLSLSPSVIAGASGSATLTITVPQNTPAGTYPITVQGSSGSKVHSVTVNVQVLNPDFTLTANPASLNIRRGNTATSTISLNPINGYTGSATVTTIVAPSGLKITLNSGTVSATYSSRMTVDALAAARGTYMVTVTGTDGPTVRTATVRVTVR